MGFTLEHNCLLVLSDEQLSSFNLVEQSAFTVVKDGQRLYPINIPFEFCNKDYKYIGKVIVSRLTIEKDSTTLEGKIVKIFTSDEAKVFTDNFISPDAS